MATNENATFTGRVAFVTGAAGGIGRATALTFAREGASVVVADVSDQENRETARMIEAAGGRALGIRCDVTRAEDVKAAQDMTLFRRFLIGSNRLCCTTTHLGLLAVEKLVPLQDGTDSASSTARTLTTTLQSNDF